MLYDSEMQTVVKEEQRRIKDFEMSCYRRMLKISEMDMVTNKEVLERMSGRKTLWSSIRKRKK